MGSRTVFKKTSIIWLVLLAILGISSATEGFEVKRAPNGYMMTFTEDGGTYCWYMPSNVDINAFPENWTPAVEAQVTYNWPPAPAGVYDSCPRSQELWTVKPFRAGDTTRVCYQVDGFQDTRVAFGRASVGASCSTPIADTTGGKWMVTEGSQGPCVAVCSLASQ